MKSYPRRGGSPTRPPDSPRDVRRQLPADTPPGGSETRPYGRNYRISGASFAARYWPTFREPCGVVCTES